MTPTLERAWLMDTHAECAQRETLPESLPVALDIGDLAFEQLGAGRIAVRIAFQFGLGPEPQAQVSATIRLIYRVDMPASLEAKRAFALETAIPDAWPVWRSWLNTTLAAMGLPPDPLPAGLPAQLVREGEVVFDLSQQLSARLG